MNRHEPPTVFAGAALRPLSLLPRRQSQGSPGHGAHRLMVLPRFVQECTLILEDGEALAAGVLLGSEHAQVGDGFHVLSMEPCFPL